MHAKKNLERNLLDDLKSIHLICYDLLRFIYVLRRSQLRALSIAVNKK